MNAANIEFQKVNVSDVRNVRKIEYRLIFRYFFYALKYETLLCVCCEFETVSRLFVCELNLQLLSAFTANIFIITE